MHTTVLIESLFNGLCFSAVLVLVALGLAITFGVMGVINMAHGEMLMLGAYTAYVAVHGLGLNLFWSIPLAFLLVGLAGFLLEVALIRRLYGRPLDTLLATWGVSLILQQVVRLAFGPGGKSIDKPAALLGSWQAGGAHFETYRLFLIGVAGVSVAALYLCLFRTGFGLRVRAVTQNRAMAAALGIRTRWVDAATFALGSGLAGVAGCILGPYYGTEPGMGLKYIVDAFMVVILGGTGQLAGTAVGGTLVGTGNSFLADFTGNQILSKVAILLLVIAFIQFRPAGLFAPRGRVYD